MVLRMRQQIGRQIDKAQIQRQKMGHPRQFPTGVEGAAAGARKNRGQDPSGHTRDGTQSSE
eukprot:3359720-Pyramimonas_sp.AAC.1